MNKVYSLLKVIFYTALLYLVYKAAIITSITIVGSIEQFLFQSSFSTYKYLDLFSWEGILYTRYFFEDKGFPFNNFFFHYAASAFVIGIFTTIYRRKLLMPCAAFLFACYLADFMYDAFINLHYSRDGYVILYLFSFYLIGCVFAWMVSRVRKKYVAMACMLFFVIPAMSLEVSGTSSHELNKDSCLTRGDAPPFGYEKWCVIKQDENEILHGKYAAWYEDGSLLVEGEFKQGKKEGKWIYYHDDGGLWGEENYLNGQLDGIIIAMDPSGAIILDGQYKKNKKHGKWVTIYKIFQENREEYYDNGVQTGEQKTWNDNGILTMKCIINGDNTKQKCAYYTSCGRKYLENEYHLIATDRWEPTGKIRKWFLWGLFSIESTYIDGEATDYKLHWH